VPTSIQYLYLAGLVFGLLGWATARSWWHMVLHAIASDEAGKRVSTSFVRLVTNVMFVVIFLPLAGFQAFAVHLPQQIFRMTIAPIRWIKRKFLFPHV
jgi:hypothetical protein